MSRLSKISNFTGLEQGRQPMLDYLRDIEFDLQQLYNRFNSFLCLNSLQVGATNNYTKISSTGDITFVGTSGLIYGELSVSDSSTATVISSSGQGNKVQVTNFDTNGPSNNMTPDHTNDHITVTVAGTYLAIVSLHVDSVAGAGAEFGFSLYKNNGATELSNVHAHRDLAGGGGESGSMSMSGIVDLAVNDTIELWVWNEDNTQNIIITDCTIALIQIGGT